MRNTNYSINLSVILKCLLLFNILIFICSCKKDKNSRITKNKYEVVIINGKRILNQMIYFKKNNSVDFSKSQFYDIDKNNLKYYSFFDTLNTKLGVDRFIIFKTSDSLKSDFSNINELKLEEFYFTNKNLLCIKRKKLPDYGIIEDINYIKSDSLINGEKTKRIRTIYQYINFKDKPEWLEKNN